MATTRIKKVNAILCPVIPDFSSSITRSGDCKDPPNFSSQQSAVKKKMEHRRNDTDKEK
jgi:hypothetical protein